MTKIHLSLLAGLLLSSGCGGKHTMYPVEGQVTLPDGTPVDHVLLTLERRQPPLSAQATTDEDGMFYVGTQGASDGAPAGVYQVTVVETAGLNHPDQPSPRRIHPKYADPSTSGLQITVTADSRYDLILDPP